MGAVFLADRVQGFQQSVVLKVLRWTPIPKAAEEPVESEHAILRSLEHPNIVALLDNGTLPDGAPFLVLEYLNGMTIDAWCGHQRLSVRGRLSLLMQVFSAVIYAHSRLVVHGDIRPANLMVVPANAETSDPVVKLLDFGVSRWLQSGRPVTKLTGSTAAYASPELQLGWSLTGATDVYALGVLMGSLLSGVEAPSSRGKNLLTSAQYKSLSPTRQRNIATSRAATPQTLAKTLRGPLDAIIEKATASAPEDRYASVVAMADDVRRYLSDLETSVYPLGRPQQSVLWMQRHAWLTGITATMLAVLIAGGSVTVWHHHRFVAQEQETHARLLELAHLTDDFSGKLYRSTGSLPRTEQARASLLRAASTARDAVAQENSFDPQIALELARQYEEAAELEFARSDKQSWLEGQKQMDAATSLLKYVPDSRDRSEIAARISRLRNKCPTSS